MKFLLRGAATTILMACAGASIADGLSFEQAIALAARAGPTLTANAERLEAASRAAVSARAFPDPQLLFGVDNLPVNGTDQFSFSRDFMTMQRIGVMQEIPSRARRNARAENAQANIAVADAQSRVARLLAVRQTAIAWLARNATERELAQLDALVAENALFGAMLRARIANGQGAAVELVAARQEAAMIDERRDELRARRAQTIAALRQWLDGDVANLPLLGDAPDLPVDREMVYRGLPHHPEFAVLDAQGKVLDAAVAEARAARHPDWSVEVAYQRRGPLFSNMMSLQFRVDLPVLSASRQDPLIASRRAERRALDADQQADVREHQRMVESGLADYQRLGSAVDRQRAVLVPLADEKVELAMADWRSGKGGVSEVLAARRERVDAGLKLIALDGERRQVAAGLYYTYADHAGAGR
jgi:outer membrane protein TolC